MRLLQLPSGRDELLDLHPNVTVVQGLDDDSHRRLLDAVVGLARGESAADGGLLEAHGVLFELRSDLLGALEITADGLDPVVRAGDLPTQPLTVDARELRTREQDFEQLLARITEQAERQSQGRGAVAAATAAVEQARRARAEADTTAAARIEQAAALTRQQEPLAVSRRRLEDQLAERQAATAAAQAAQHEVEERTAAVREAAHAAAGHRADLEGELARVTAALDPDAATVLNRAETDLQGLTATIQAEREAALAAQRTLSEDPHEETEPVAERLERLGARLAALDHTLTALAVIDPTEVAEALALLQGGDSAERIASPEATALADELEGLHDELGGEVGEASAEPSLAAARERLEDARQVLLEATQAVRNPELDPDDVARLEEVHDALLDAIDKADGRFAGARARDRVVALRADEQDVLDRLGFASHSDYMMGSSFLQVDPATQAALTAARADLAEAESVWHRTQRATDEALSRAASLDRRRELIERARALVGAPVAAAELSAALRDLRVPVISATESASRLRLALERAGVELGAEELEQVELGMIADAWLTEVSGADGRRRAAEEERSLLREEEGPLRAEAAADEEAAARQAAEPDPEELREELLAAGRARVTDAENRWLAHEEADERRRALLAELDLAVSTAHTAGEAAAGAEAELSGAKAGVAAAMGNEQSLQDELDGASAAEADVVARRDALNDPALDPEALDAAIEAAEASRREAEEALDTETRVLSALDVEGQGAAIEIERLQDIVAAQDTGTATEADELEWYLLARLAAQRSVSVAGSMPLLLDDALRGLDATGVHHLLDRLERMAEAVQVIVVSEDPLVASWATAVGPARAAVVRPGAGVVGG